MMDSSRKGITKVETGERCDTRVWSGACDRGLDNDTTEKYLCTYCEQIPGLDHEVRHEIFPHVSGDYSRMM